MFTLSSQAMLFQQADDPQMLAISGTGFQSSSVNAWTVFANSLGNLEMPVAIVADVRLEPRCPSAFLSLSSKKPSLL